MDDEAKRRERAYRIWLEEGQPHGRDLDHWQRAQEQSEANEEAIYNGDVVKPTRVARPPKNNGKAPAKAPRPVRE